MQTSGRPARHASASVRDGLWRWAGGFSLVELLIVVAIMAIMAGLAGPAISSIGQARGVAEAGFQVETAIERARSEAIARRTFVWLGLQQETNAGSVGLRIGLVYSKDGTANGAATNLAPVARSILVERTGLLPAAETDAGAGLPSATEIANFTGGLKPFTIGNITFDSGRTVTFTPMGEATTNPRPSRLEGFVPLMSVGLQSTRSTNLVPGNDIAVLLDGAVGIPMLHTVQ